MTEKNIERSIGRLEGKMDNVVSEITALRVSFDNLEKGRFSKLEIAFAELHTNVKSSARIAALWTSGIVAITVSVIVAVMIKILNLK